MLFCDNCGSKLNPEAKFCHNCGKRIAVPASPANNFSLKSENANVPAVYVSNEVNKDVESDKVVRKRRLFIIFAIFSTLMIVISPIASLFVLEGLYKSRDQIQSELTSRIINLYRKCSKIKKEKNALCIKIDQHLSGTVMHSYYQNEYKKKEKLIEEYLRDISRLEEQRSKVRPSTFYYISGTYYIGFPLLASIFVIASIFSVVLWSLFFKSFQVTKQRNKTKAKVVILYCVLGMIEILGIIFWICLFLHIAVDNEYSQPSASLHGNSNSGYGNNAVSNNPQFQIQKAQQRVLQMQAEQQRQAMQNQLRQMQMQLLNEINAGNAIINNEFNKMSGMGSYTPPPKISTGRRCSIHGIVYHYGSCPQCSQPDFGSGNTAKVRCSLHGYYYDPNIGCPMGH